MGIGAALLRKLDDLTGLSIYPRQRAGSVTTTSTQVHLHEILTIFRRNQRRIQQYSVKCFKIVE